MKSTESRGSQAEAEESAHYQPSAPKPVFDHHFLWPYQRHLDTLPEMDTTVIVRACLYFTA